MIRARRWFATVMAVAGSALLIAPLAVAQEDVRLDTDLFGFDIEATAAPVTVRIFENFIPIPVDPGEPQMEATLSHSATRLGTGPSGRAVASSVWPGAALGDGFGTVIGDEDQSYPIRAAAVYPGAGEVDWEQSCTGGQCFDDGAAIPGLEGIEMFASAKGLDVTARAEGAGLAFADAAIIRHGQLRSESTSTVVDGQATARSVSAVQDVHILEGIIVLRGVTTVITASSDGVLAETSGRTTIGGIEILGQPVLLTDEGAVIDVDQDEDDQIGSLLDPVNTIIQRLVSDLVADGIEETLGIQIEALDHEQVLDGTIAERVAGGVRVVINTRVLRSYLQPILALVPIGDLLDTLPDELADVRGYVFEVLGLGPRLEFVIGRGAVTASASPAFLFEPPNLPPPPPPPALPQGDGMPLPSVPLGPPTDSGPMQPPGVAAPDVAGPTTPGPVLAAADPPARFGGIPLAAAATLLLLLAVPTWGLTTLREGAVGATAGTATAQPLPDLRGGA